MRNPGCRSSRLCSAASARKKPTRRSRAAKRTASCLPPTTPRASAVSPGKLNRTCPSATRRSILRAYSEPQPGAWEPVRIGEMASPVDDLAISPEELRAALASHDLPALVVRLARERSWGALILLFGHAASPDGAARLGLAELDAAAHAFELTLVGLPVPKNARVAPADELRPARIAAAEALLARGAHPPLTELERRAARRAAALLAAAGDHARAAGAHEELGD